MHPLRLCPPNDHRAVRTIHGADEFARPRLLAQYPHMSAYLADEASPHYLDGEPTSTFVAAAEGEVVGALLGCTDTRRFRRFTRHRVQPLLVRRCLSGAYGWPGWAPAILRTESASRGIAAPPVDLNLYPAHLHIGVLPRWKRHGIGTALMNCFSAHLRDRGVPGFHLYASSLHPLGTAFDEKLGLEQLGEFPWHLYDDFEWRAGQM